MIYISYVFIYSYYPCYYWVLYSLFFGVGHGYPINISSIRIIKTKRNYQEIIQAITILDNILSGNIEEKISKKSLLILNHLIVERKENKFDPFIYNSWKTFLQKKTEIKIDMDNLNKYITDLGFLGLIFGGRGLELHRRDLFDDNFKNNYYIPDDMTNILKLNVLNVFPNLQTMVIGWLEEHPFSLHQLALLLKDTKIKMVEIEAAKNSSWLFYLWSDKSSSLIKAYKNKGYSIEVDGKFDYTFVISIKLL